jgi:hypothetical protein
LETRGEEDDGSEEFAVMHTINNPPEGSKKMFEEWKSYSGYTKTVLVIYFLISLPLLPLMAIMIPFAWWVAAPQGVLTRRQTLADFLSLSVALSLLAYILVAVLHWCPSN